MLQLGFFEDFNGEDTLLIWSEGAGFEQFYTCLRDIAEQNVSEVALHLMPWVKPIGGTELFLKSTPGVGETVRRYTSKNGVTVSMTCSAEQFAEFADKIDALRPLSCVDGHQYLDTPHEHPLQIVASKGEYPANFGQTVRPAIQCRTFLIQNWIFCNKFRGRWWNR